MKKIKLFFLGLIVIFFSCNKKIEKSSLTKKPNIVIIYLDDLGYGDLSSYGATSFKTPNIDALAENGIKFTNAYASSATCTPSRYALLTGTYPWRNKNAKILPGTAPLLISPKQETLPKLLRKAGYATGIVGKWHLGLGTGHVNWNKHISPGPNEVGFDQSYIMAATQDRVPTVYINNGKVVNLDIDDPIEINYQQNFEGEPTGKDNPELLKMKWHHGHNSSIINGIPRIGYMKGGNSAKWVDEDMADHFLAKAQEYVKSHKEKPFFLYYAMQQPHVPRTPHPRFIGKSGLGPRGDVIVEADWIVGEFMKTLKKEGVLNNTIVILSSDNGPVLNDGYFDDAEEKIGNHDPNGGLRGGKYSLFEAGTRVPFIISYPNIIQPKTSNALISQLDILASLAKLIGISNLKDLDSKELTEVLLGKNEVGRNQLVLEATSRTALRSGNWLLIPPYKGLPSFMDKVKIETGSSDNFQLYNLKDDIHQTTNLAQKYPEKVKQLFEEFIKIRGKNYSKTQKLELK